MFQKRCYLCGGKLLNGRCQDCGLDNQKNIERNYRLNGSKVSGSVGQQMEGESDWQSRDIERKTARRNIVNEKAGNAKLKASQRATSRPVKSTGSAGTSRMSGGVRTTSGSTLTYDIEEAKKKQKKGSIICTVIIVLIIIGGMAWDVIKDSDLNFMTSRQEADADPYEYATRELSDSGEQFETELQPGSYQVGVHIPEGAYTIERKSGSGEAYLQDYENCIYLTWYFGDGSEQDEILSYGGVRLYQGAILEVSGNISLNVVTQNGQNAKMSSMENPLTEKFMLRKGTAAVAGVDFPAGVYDFHSVNDWTGISYEVPLHTDYEDETLNVSEMNCWLSDTGMDSQYCNAVLPVGTEITAEDADVELVPSEIIQNEEYDNYYVN